MTITLYDHMFSCPTHNIYDVTFFGDRIRTLATNSPSMVESWISEIEFIHRKRLGRLIVGLYTEHWYPIATLQLCVGHRCLFFHMIHTSSIPQALKNFLLNKSYSFVGFKVEEGLKRLEKVYNLSVGNVIDLTTLAAQVLGRDMEESKKAGLEDLCEKVLRKKVAKKKVVEFIGRGISSDQVQFVEN